MLTPGVVLNMCVEIILTEDTLNLKTGKFKDRKWRESVIVIFFQYFSLSLVREWSLWLLYLHNEGSVCVWGPHPLPPGHWVRLTDRKWVSCRECGAGFLLSLSFSPFLAPSRAFRHCCLVAAFIRSTVELLDFPSSLSLCYSTILTLTL